jgi:hypothetical protein
MDLQTLTELFEKYGFTKLICPFAVGLYNSAELEIDIEVIIVHNKSGENFYRLYAAGEERNGLLTYYHSFVKNEEELKDFIEKAKGLLPESVPAETLVRQGVSQPVNFAETLQIALDNWKRCYVAYGREVMREELQETLDLLSEDKDWQKVNAELSKISA